MHNGREVNKVVTHLSTKYHVQWQILRVRSYGDPTNRARLFIVGTRRDITADANMSDIQFVFPEAIYEGWNMPTIRDLMLPDDDLPTIYWRSAEHQGQRTKYQSDWALNDKMRVVARSCNNGRMGPSSLPNAIQSMDTFANSQTTYNGGGRRPRLDWVDNNQNDVGPTRLAAPIEAIRFASLSDSYYAWIRQNFNSCVPSIRRDGRAITLDEFIFMSVNNGIPMRTSYAVDSNVMLWLKRIKYRKAEVAYYSGCVFTPRNLHLGDISLSHLEARKKIIQQGATVSNKLATLSQTWCDYTESDPLSSVTKATKKMYHCYLSKSSIALQSWINSALFDTGANIGVFNESVEGNMISSTKSRLKIQVADTNFMEGRRDGMLHMLFVDPTTGNYANDGNTFSYKVTTVKNLAKDLFSIDDLYAHQNFNVILRQPGYENGQSEIFRPSTKGSPPISIPLRYDYQHGGFYVDYILPSGGERDNNNRRSLFSAYHADTITMSKLAGEDVLLNDHQVIALVSTAFNTDAVTELVFGQHEESAMRNIRGVKAGLRTRKKKLTARDFHTDHGHIGCVGPCAICDMASGCCRRIYALVDKHREIRRGHTWVMDACTVEHRSFDGSKYMVILRDKMSLAFDLVFLHLRSDAIAQLSQWIKRMRSDPAFRNLGYDVVSFIETDDAGEWGWKNEEWAALETEFSFRTSWKCPDRKKALAPEAERAVGIIEVTMKCLLLERDLQHGWWKYCADAAKFLLNRFPVLSQLSTMPKDGDQARPLEVLTGGLHSRRQCDRELSYFLAPGTPVLCHDPNVKGSQLQAKSTWKVACGMQEEQALLWSPYTRMIARSKSWTAFKLESGTSYTTFLKLQPEPQSRRQAQIPSDLLETVYIKLPNPNAMDHLTKIGRSGQPLIAVKHSMDSRMGPPTVTYGVDKDTAPTKLGGSVVVQDQNGKTMKTDLSNGQLYLDESDEESDQDDTPRDPSWGKVPNQQDGASDSLECKICRVAFRTRNLLFKHLNLKMWTFTNCKSQRQTSGVCLMMRTWSRVQNVG